ncbi:response regulator [Sphingomonas sp. BK235]|uniref:response regulator n=1 Tax=Sphingomonas sp. BK235 TaxID=2512131 RepID=UPI001047430D|nr:response regulator [Sphingomonas sp. BK235]TCP33680.1 DNA-binding response OmpR family regulator [Sphingomonas sp. BK235]
MTYIDTNEFATHTKAARILVVDDDPAMQRMIVGYLIEHGLRAAAVGGRKGLFHALSVREPDLVVLDLHLGEDDGLEILRELRAKSVVPVILVTGNRREEIDRVLGLELGADDYLTKPFGLRELLARVRATLRRRTMDRMSPARPHECTFRFAGWSFDQRRRELTSPTRETVALTKGEFALLSAFVQAPHRALSREHLLQATRVHEDVYDRSIDVQILRLRRKLEETPSAPRFIRTERGVGYKFDVDVEMV